MNISPLYSTLKMLERRAFMGAIYRKFNRFATLSCILLVIFSCESKKYQKALETNVENRIEYTVKMVFPHDETAFTQGLVIHKNKVYESTGFHNQIPSWIAEVNLDNGEQHKRVELDSRYFGEGICVLNNKLYQLTWKENTGFIYDLKTFKNTGSFSYNSEGWGLTTDQQHLIMSDGTENIRFLDTLTFEVVKTIVVREGNIPVKNINELEFIKGYLYANLWKTSLIVKIDPDNGKVVGVLDLSSLVNSIERTHPEADVLNGIAYNSETGDILVTGKLWPKAYLIRPEE